MELKGLTQVLHLDPLRLLEGQGTLKTLLAQLSGSELEAILAGRTPDGLLLQLSNGRTVVAGGEVPFPPGTQLVLRAVPAPDSGALRLQLLEATPPPPSPVLVPLEQGEAAALLARVLGAEEVPALLEPLRALLAAAQAEPREGLQPQGTSTPHPVPSPAAATPPPAPGAPPTTTSTAPPTPAQGTTAGPATGGAPPTAAQVPSAPLPLLRAWISALQPAFESAPPTLPGPQEGTGLPTAVPPPALTPLTQALVERGVPPPEAEAWATFFLASEDAAPPSQGELLHPAAGEALPQAAESPVHTDAARPPLWLPKGIPAAGETEPAERPPLDALLAELRQAQVAEPLAQRLLPLLALARPTPGGGAIEQLIRSLLPQIPVPPTAPAPPPERLPSDRPLPATPPPPALLQPEAPQPWDQPEPWQRWLQHATTALSDPQSSPREAPFHALQAREGTALFELPLPLPGLRSPVELWVERDGNPSEAGEAPVRVLLALEFEGTGPVRLSVQGLAGRFQANLWVDEARRPQVAQALAEALGDPPPFAVKVLGFHGPQPSLRRAAGAGPFGAMG